VDRQFLASGGKAGLRVSPLADQVRVNEADSAYSDGAYGSASLSDALGAASGALQRLEHLTYVLGEKVFGSAPEPSRARDNPPPVNGAIDAARALYARIDATADRLEKIAASL
jgi:hypothetical protein